jgi:hypothetical protein
MEERRQVGVLHQGNDVLQIAVGIPLLLERAASGYAFLLLLLDGWLLSASLLLVDCCGDFLGGLIPDITIPLPSFSRTSCWVRCFTGIVVVLLFGEGRLQICRSDANTTALQYLRSTNPRSLYLAALGSVV